MGNIVTKALLLVLLLVTLRPVLASAEAGREPDYRIPLTDMVTEIPNTAWTSLKQAFDRDKAPHWVWITMSTGMLYYYDEDLFREARHTGRELGLGNEDNTKTIVKMGRYDILRLPSDAGSALYFFGDGWIHTVFAAAFMINGAVAGGNRAWNTGIEMFHGMAVSTLFSQSIKRATGRQSPNQETEPRGAWHPFPSIPEYGRHTARYDAFPSGHIMTAALSFTVMYENYPEYRSYLLPIGTIWCTVLGFQMVNNGVHWASDYPLGVAMGVYFGRQATKLGKTDLSSAEKAGWWDRVAFFPGVDGDARTLNAAINF